MRRIACAFLLVTAVVAACAPAAAASIYWTEATNPIGRANLDGSDVDRSFVIGANMPTGVAVDGEHVFWAENAANLGTTIGRADLSGLHADPAFIDAGPIPTGVAVQRPYVYWVTATGTIGRARVDGSASEKSFITTAKYPCGVAVDAQHIYWANRDIPATIGRANLDGTGVDLAFITGLGSSPCGVAVDAQHIFWGGFTTGSVGRANLDGTGVDQDFVPGGNFPFGVAVDGEHLYWGNCGGDSLGRADLDGTHVDQRFITGLNRPCGVAVDALLPSQTTLSASRSSLTFGEPVTFTATVTTPGATPTGAVQFSVNGDDDGTPVPLDSSGRATYTPAWPLNVGDAVVAIYRGTPARAPSHAEIRPALVPAATAMQLASTPNPVAPGGDVDVAVRVVNTSTAITPFGSVQFAIDGQPVGPPAGLDDSGAVAVRVTADVPEGTYRVTASYRDDTAPVFGTEDFLASSASLVQRVVKPAASPAPTPVPTPVTPAAPRPTGKAELRAMTAALIRKLKARGFSALTDRGQRLTASVPGTLDQRLYARKHVLIATARYVFRKPGQGSLALRMTSAGRRVTRDASRLKLEIVTRFAASTGPAVSVTQRVTASRRG